MGAELDTSTAKDVPSLEGIGRIRAPYSLEGARRIQASSEGVLGKTGAHTPPSAEVLNASLGTGTKGGLVG